MSEELLRRLGAQHFLREFSFSDATYQVPRVGEFELGDHLVYLDAELMLVELKERESPNEPTADSEREWFKHKVIGDAISQLQGNLQRLQTGPITVRNQAGHAISIDLTAVRKTRKLVTYLPRRELPTDCTSCRGRESGRAGFVHIMPLADYVLVVETLVTPVEIFEYLDFREEMLKRTGVLQPGVGEKALLGQYIADEPGSAPSAEFEARVDRVGGEPNHLWLMKLLADFKEHIIYSGGNADAGETSYYRILQEVARLDRAMAKELQARLAVALDDVRRGEPRFAMRLYSANARCAFVVIPAPPDPQEMRLKAMTNITALGKHSLRADRAVGICCTWKDGQVEIDWCFMEWPWEPRGDLDQLLRDASPFPGLKSGVRYRYGGGKAV